jgi:RNA 2',3'-cyclic 3'-phosphodiesterase
MRLFYALLPDDLTRRRLSEATDRLTTANHGRLVAPRNIHITLAFIGEVSELDLNLCREMGATLGLRRCAIDLELIEYWSKPRAIVFCARKNPYGLATQTSQLRTAVAQQVHPRRDEKPWRAHVTLARKVAQAPVLTAMSPVTWVSHSFCLMSSRTDGDDSVYTVVDSWPLLDKP